MDGQSHDALHEDLIAVEVHERVGEPSSFALQVAIYKREHGGWTRLDTDTSEGGFAPWQRLTISAGFEDRPDVLIDGYVAGVAPRFETVEANSHLLVWGYDASYAMDIEEKVRAWPDKKYSEIATEIFSAYGIEPRVTDTQVMHPERGELLIQRGTDWQFLKHLARRVGFDVFARGGRGYFRPPDLNATPQKDLVVHFGERATNVLWFEPRLVGDLPTKVNAARVNTLTKRVESTEVTSSPLRALGGRPSDALQQTRLPDVRSFALVSPEPWASEEAMEAMAVGLRRTNDWVVTGEGELDGTTYGRALRADGVVLIKGVGRTFTGRYYVTEVIHRITPESYTQRFKVMRNALDVEGNEPFQDANADPSAPAGNDEHVDVRATGRVVSS